MALGGGRPSLALTITAQTGLPLRTCVSCLARSVAFPVVPHLCCSSPHIAMKSRYSRYCHHFLSFLLTILFVNPAESKFPSVQHKVRCSPKEMQVEMRLSEDVSQVYLEGRKDLQQLGCEPNIEGNTATFRLSLTDVFQCGVTKVVDKTNDHRLYYHRVIVEYADESTAKEVILVKCAMAPHHNHQSQQQQQQLNKAQPERPSASRTLIKRDTLPEGFQEEDIEILEITNVTGRAPEVVLGIDVRQNGQVVGSDLTVQPGTLLQMDIYLDSSSSSTYGLLVSYMDVTDNRNKEETIILGGCSVDPYLFENFNTLDGKALSARFRAFKFPESNYVQFRGTIDVCLGRCDGVECSAGVTGFGRRKRAVDAGAKSKWRPNKVFEVTMTTVLKIQDGEELLRKDTIVSKTLLAEIPDSILRPRAIQSADSESFPQSASNSARSFSSILTLILLFNAARLFL